jgi:hypothetical protein
MHAKIYKLLEVHRIAEKMSSSQMLFINVIKVHKNEFGMPLEYKPLYPEHLLYMDKTG